MTLRIGNLCLSISWGQPKKQDVSALAEAIAKSLATTSSVRVAMADLQRVAAARSSFSTKIAASNRDLAALINH